MLGKQGATENIIEATTNFCAHVIYLPFYQTGECQRDEYHKLPRGGMLLPKWFSICILDAQRQGNPFLWD